MFDGNIWQETNDNTVHWKEEFECQWCLTTRITPLEPGTAIVIGARKYFYHADYDKDLQHDVAYRTVTRRIFEASRVSA